MQLMSPLKTLLHKKKYLLLKHDLSTAFGLIRLLARDGQALVVIEELAEGESSIAPERVQQLTLALPGLAREYTASLVRIDTIQVQDSKIRHQKGIVEFHG